MPKFPAVYMGSDSCRAICRGSPAQQEMSPDIQPEVWPHPFPHFPREELMVINRVLTQSCWGIQEIVGTAGPPRKGLDYGASMQMKSEGPG